MSGVASVVLTDKEIHALLVAAPSHRRRVTDSVWAGLEPKLRAALEPISCPVRPKLGLTPRRPEKPATALR